MMRLTRYGGNPNIGVFAAVNESLAFVASDTSQEFIRDVENALQVETIMTTMAGSFVVGSMVAMNSYGAVVSDLALQSELDRFREHIPVLELEEKVNAAGNNILVNDNGALINPDISVATAKLIEDFLGVEVVRGRVSQNGIVGSLCCATNKGCVCNTEASDEEMKLIADVLKVEVQRASVNHGVKFLGAGILANSKGALIGDETTPIEMGKIEDGLVLY